MSDEIKLPTARQAMRYAVEIAGDVTAGPDDIERAHLWIEIAAELRVGTVPQETPVAIDETKLLDYGQRMQDVPEDPPAFRSVDQTQVMEYQRCRNCLGLLKMAYGEDDEALVHVVSMQTVCPTEWPDGKHTFAEVQQ